MARCGQSRRRRWRAVSSGGRFVKIRGRVMSEISLDGVKVIVVEDEVIVAMLLEQMLEDLGCTVTGTAGQLASAVTLVNDSDADVAILDMNLAGHRVDPVARILAENATPSLFPSGPAQHGLSAAHRPR